MKSFTGILRGKIFSFLGTGERYIALLLMLRWEMDKYIVSALTEDMAKEICTWEYEGYILRMGFAFSE
ncbi:MAG: hypothetical protein ACYCYE_14710 [Clostridia bacterium]